MVVKVKVCLVPLPPATRGPLLSVSLQGTPAARAQTMSYCSYNKKTNKAGYLFWPPVA